jgi:hypothetical protein
MPWSDHLKEKLSSNRWPVQFHGNLPPAARNAATSAFNAATTLNLQTVQSARHGGRMIAGRTSPLNA